MSEHLIGACTLKQAPAPPTHLVSDLPSPACYQGWFRAPQTSQGGVLRFLDLSQTRQRLLKPFPLCQTCLPVKPILSLHAINPFSTSPASNRPYLHLYHLGAIYLLHSLRGFFLSAVFRHGFRSVPKPNLRPIYPYISVFPGKRCV